jgi:hypothetical protein
MVVVIGAAPARAETTTESDETEMTEVLDAGVSPASSGELGSPT